MQLSSAPGHAFVLTIQYKHVLVSILHTFMGAFSEPVHCAKVYRLNYFLAPYRTYKHISKYISIVVYMYIIQIPNQT